MANQEVPDLTAAGTLDGNEQVHVVQGGNSRRSLLSTIATFVTDTLNGTSIITAINGQLGTGWQNTGDGTTPSNLDDLGDVDFTHGGLTADQIGRPLGLVAVSPSPKVALLDQLKSMPISGGIEILAENDFALTPGIALTAADTHLYDEVHVYFFDIEADNTLNVRMYPDGINEATYDFLAARLFKAGASTPDGATTEQVGEAEFYILPTPARASGVAKFTGMKAGLPLSGESFAGCSTTPHVNREMAVVKEIGECRGLALETASGQITSGYAFIVGVRHASQPLAVPFDYSGSPAGAETLGRFVVPMTAKVRAGAQGSFKVVTNPTAETVLEVHQNGSSIGTVTIPATTGDPVVAVTADTDLAAGDILTLEATASGDFTDIYGALLAEGRG